MQIDEFDTRDEAFEAVASYTINALHTSLEANGRASLLLSGGRTPSTAYEMIARSGLAWDNISIGLVDDRWVDDPDPASNALLVRESVLEKGAQKASFVPMKTSHNSPDLALPEVEAAYLRFQTPDVAIIGLGPDGHTASWFPGATGSGEAMSPDNPNCIAAIDASGSEVAGDHPARITVTLPVLARAKHVVLLITGDEKKSVLLNSAAGLPIHRLFDARQNAVKTIWTP